jgi:hypothetical protein
MNTQTDIKRAEWRKGAYVVKAEWSGGAYIELTMPDCVEPSEVINVWDYEKGEADIPFTESALQDTLNWWCGETFGESNPDGDYNLRAYISNASY